MSSVGFTARKIDPVEELRVAYQNLTKIQQTIHAIRQCLKTQDFRQIDAELVALADLGRSLRDPQTLLQGRRLLEALRKRRNLYAVVVEEIDDLLTDRRKAGPEPMPLAQTPNPSPKSFPVAKP